MSTTKLREALARAEILGGRAESEAWAELEAIEKAAEVVVREGVLEDWISCGPVALGDAFRLFQAIAREAKR
jgi:hypothetical protein